MGIRMKVKPNDLQVGDRLDQLTPDLSVVSAPITVIDKERHAQQTVYKVFVKGQERPIYYSPNATVEITREV